MCMGGGGGGLGEGFDTWPMDYYMYKRISLRVRNTY